MPSFNLSEAIANAKPTSFEPVPAGNYNAVVAKVSYGFSKAGNPMFSVQFRITDGEYEGRTLFRHIAFTEKSVNISVEAFAAMGVGQDVLLAGLADDGDPDVVARAALEAEVILKVEEREYDGRGTNDVKRISPRRPASGSAAIRPAVAPPARPF